MAAAQIALQGAQEYLDQTQALSAAALADFEIVEYENFSSLKQFRTPGRHIISQLIFKTICTLGVAQLEEATQYAVDLYLQRQELINALGELGFNFVRL